MAHSSNLGQTDGSECQPRPQRWFMAPRPWRWAHSKHTACCLPSSRASPWLGFWPSPSGPQCVQCLMDHKSIQKLCQAWALLRHGRGHHTPWNGEPPPGRHDTEAHETREGWIWASLWCWWDAEVLWPSSLYRPSEKSHSPELDLVLGRCFATPLYGLRSC